MSIQNLEPYDVSDPKNKTKQTQKKTKETKSKEKHTDAHRTRAEQIRPQKNGPFKERGSQASFQAP